MTRLNSIASDTVFEANTNTGGLVMKSLIYAMVAASVLATPLASMAQTQSNQPVTREQVRQDLIRLEQAGYEPRANDINYPATIQAAEQRAYRAQGQAVAETSPTAADASGYGGVEPQNGQSGAPAERPTNADGGQPIFFGR